jgi:carbamoyltransferase
MAPVILGLNTYFHDASACLVVDGKLVCALEEERFNRDKHTTAFPRLAVQKCLEVAGLTIADVDVVAVAADPNLDVDRKLLFGLRHGLGARGVLQSEVKRFATRKIAFQRWFNSQWPNGAVKRPQVQWVEHHHAHVIGSFLVSPYREAALLGIDGSGEWATSYLGHAVSDASGATTVTRFQQSYFPQSMGAFYEAVTDWLGFRPNYDEGKTMGLAPYGDAKPFLTKAQQLFHVDEDFGFHLDLSYFQHQRGSERRFSSKFVETFGAPRAKADGFSQYHHDVAASFQRVLEDRGLELCTQLHARTKAKHLVIAGGVALNSVMNGRIVREGPFEDLYVMPGAGDNGTCIGAAYTALWKITGRRSEFVHDSPYVGNAYSDEDVLKAIRYAGAEIERHDDIERVAAELLNKGRILGWHQGAMEFGPRALGSRSILANPTLPDMKAVLNARVKHREPFRPFAPSSIAERAREFFDARVDDPFMLKVCYVRPEWRERLPAITHVDGSARLQIVHQHLHPRYHKLIQEFGQLSGVPVVLNTSFNVMGEPIVESPMQALRCFFTTGIDELIIGNYIVRKYRH